MCGAAFQEHSPVHYPADEGSGRGPLCSLDNNQAHFILVEPGPSGKGDGLTELRLKLEKHISEQRTGYGGEACPGGTARGRGPKDDPVGRWGFQAEGEGVRRSGCEPFWRGSRGRVGSGAVGQRLPPRGGGALAGVFARAAPARGSFRGLPTLGGKRICGF